MHALGALVSYLDALEAASFMDSRVDLAPEDIEAAATAFGAPDCLCFCSGMITNSGFAASISFNSPEHRTARGTISIALRNATLTFQTPPVGAIWHEEISELVSSSTKAIQIRETVVTKEATQTAKDLDAHVDGGGTIKVPLFGEIRLGSKISEAKRRSDASEISGSRETTATQTANDLEMQRTSANTFQVTFRAGHESDLVSYNPQLGHINVLTLPTPSDVKSEDISVAISSRIIESATEIQHSVRIRAATGCWSGLSKTPNHQIMSELVLSKIIRPAHGERRIWPANE